MLTTVFSDIAGANNLQAMAIDAATGAIQWTTLMGEGDRPPGFKASVPMVHDGVMYAGNTINQTFQALDVATGAQLWVTDLTSAEDPAPQRPRGAAVFADGRVIHASGRHVRTFDPATGEILNDFLTAGVFALFGVTQPAVVGNQIYLSSISGWVFAAPVDFITTESGFSDLPPEISPPLQPASFFDADALPSPGEAGPFPDTWLAYAGNQANNAVVASGVGSFEWQFALPDALPLNGPPLDEAIYGTEEATMMTHLAFGAGSGLAVANGIVYGGSDRGSVHAINASTGNEIWRFDTFNANFGQPLVTPDTVVVGGGDQWTNLGGTGDFRRGDPFTVGASLQHLTGLDPLTGNERWTVYTGPGTSGMTPLYHEGNVIWVTGQGTVYAVDAGTGQPVAPLMDEEGNPVLRHGFNAISSGNVFRQQGNHSDLMIVGTGRPDQITAINLDTAAVEWTQDLSDFDIGPTGFSAVSVAVDQMRRRVIGTVVIDADPVNDTATILAFGLDARTGAVRWARNIGTGSFPLGFVAPTPVLGGMGGRAFIASPITDTVVALNTGNGMVKWQAPVPAEPGRFSWGPGAVVDGILIQPIGQDLFAFDTMTGSIANWVRVGGSFTYNNPVVVGDTLFIGNSFGWVNAMPLSVLTGGS